MLVSSNPAFLAYLGLPISHIRQNPKNARFFHYFLFPHIFPYSPGVGLALCRVKFWGLDTLDAFAVVVVFCPWLDC